MHMGRQELGSRLDEATQITNWELEREFNRLENDREEYPPTCGAANESTRSTGLSTCQFPQVSRDNQARVLWLAE